MFPFLFPSQKHSGVGLGVFVALPGQSTIRCFGRLGAGEGTKLLMCLVKNCWGLKMIPQNSRFWWRNHLDFTHSLSLFEKWVVSEGLWADWSSKPRLPGEQKCIVKSVCEAFGLSTFEASDSQELIVFKMFYVFWYFSKLSQGFFWKCGIKQISTSTCTMRAESQVTLHVDDLVFSWQHRGRTEPRWHTEFYTQLLERDKVL